MTHPTDYSFHPRSESGQGRHTQESGDAGLSSNMEHKFSDNYTDGASPVADKGSFVIPIPKGELDISEKIGKIWSHPSVFGHAGEQFHTKAESHPAYTVEGFLKSSTVSQEEHSPPLSTTSHTLSENSPEEKTDKILPGTTAITEKQPDVDVEGEENCIMGTKMVTGTNADKPKGHRLVSAEKRKVSHHKKKAAGRNQKLNLLCWMVLIHVPLSEGVAGNCFTCVDKDRCPNLVSIYNSDDNTVFNGLNQTFTTCCGASPPTAPKTCAVCRDQSDTIKILCSEDVEKVEVEDNDGDLKTSPSVCELQNRCDRAHTGLIAGAVLFGVAVAALLICSCCQRCNRTENSEN